MGTGLRSVLKPAAAALFAIVVPGAIAIGAAAFAVRRMLGIRRKRKLRRRAGAPPQDTFTNTPAHKRGKHGAERK